MPVCAVRKSTVGAAVLVCGMATCQTAGRAQQTPVFRGGVELVTVDATVVDRDGRPVEGLQSDDFAVTVDGRPRRIVTVEFTRFDAQPAGAKPVPVAAGAGELAASESAGRLVRRERLILLAFDHSSFYATGQRQATLAARKFLATLDPADRVGLVTFPQTGVYVTPTTDRALVERELGHVFGTAIRPTADGRPFVSLTESAAIRDGDRFTLDRVRARECAGLHPSQMQICLDHIQMVAGEHVVESQERTAQSLRGLGDVIDRLGARPGRKVMVLISGGMVTSLTRSGESSGPLLTQVASRAAAANVAVHVIHVDTGALDGIEADHRQLSQTIVSDVGLLSSGLKDVAASTGGDLTTVMGDASAGFDRITRTISAAYVLGIETEPADRDGRSHAIRVTVRRPGTRVLSRQQFRVTSARATASSPADRVAEALRTGRGATELPLRVAIFRMKDVATGGLRVLVRADAGRGVAGPAELTVGMAFVSEAGDVSLTDIGPSPLPSSDGPDACWLLQGLMPVPPGANTVRVALTGPDGRLGSEGVRFTAAVPRGAGVSHSDLMLYDPARFGAAGPVPLIDGQVTGTRVSVVLEVYPDEASSVTDVDFELSKAGEPRPLHTSPGGLAREADGAVVAAETDFDLSGLPPGDYTVTAIVTATTGEAARTTATFRKGR